MKKIIYTSLTLFLLSGAVIAVQSNRFDKSTNGISSSKTPLCKNTGTTTICLTEKYTEKVFNSEFEEQGACLAIKDADGIGFTYLTANNGVPSYSSLGCGK